MSDETHTEVEIQAIELGWQPEEDFKADPKNEGKKWRSAEDFMDRQPLFEKIDAQGREVKELKRALTSLTEQNKKVEKLAYDKALADLKKQKVQALEEEDHAKVVEIDDSIQDLKNHRPEETKPQLNPQFEAWVSENKWYANDEDMRAVADGIGMSLARQGKLSPEEIMVKVTERIKEIYPTKFGRTTKVPPNPDSGGTRKANGSGSGGVESMMTDMERRIMNTIIQTGLSKEDYLKQFVETQPERFKGVKL